MIENFSAGNTLTLDVAIDNNYGPSNSYDLFIALRGPDAINIRNGEAGVTITSSGDTYEVIVTSSITATYTPGDYSYTIYTYDTDERYQHSSGTISILPDIEQQVSGYDGRSQYKKTLDAIDAVLEGRASQDQSSYSIAGRSLSRTPIPDLIELRNYYFRLYTNEQQKQAIENGTGTGRRIKVVLP